VDKIVRIASSAAVLVAVNDLAGKEFEHVLEGQRTDGL
jgi:hypothetical protein